MTCLQFCAGVNTPLCAPSILHQCQAFGSTSSSQQWRITGNLVRVKCCVLINFDNLQVCYELVSYTTNAT